MPRYFFDLTDGGEFARDDEGLELPDRQAVQVEAARSLADIAKHAIWSKAETIQDHRMAIELRDEHGPVLKAKFSFELEGQS